MSSFDSPGGSGVALIIAGIIVVSLVDTMLTGSVIHWIPIIAAIVVGLWAVAAINGN